MCDSASTLDHPPVIYGGTEGGNLMPVIFGGTEGGNILPIRPVTRYTNLNRNQTILSIDERL